MSGPQRPDPKTDQAPVHWPGAHARAVLATVGTGSLKDLCAAWKRADLGLEDLSREWSQAEALTLRTKNAATRSKARARMRFLDRQIARMDRERSRLLGQVLATPAGSPEEAIGKLFIAERLLGGEGGPEHRLVADVVRRLSAGPCLDT